MKDFQVTKGYMPMNIQLGLRIIVGMRFIFICVVTLSSFTVAPPQLTGVGGAYYILYHLSERSFYGTVHWHSTIFDCQWLGIECKNEFQITNQWKSLIQVIKPYQNQNYWSNHIKTPVKFRFSRSKFSLWKVDKCR